MDYVKDKNNLLTHSQWSTGEYDNTLSIVDWTGQKSEISSNYSSVGETSYKITRIEDSQYWSDIILAQSLSSYTVSCNIYSPSANGYLFAVTRYSDGTTTDSYVGFTAMDKIQSVSCNGIVTSGKTVSRVTLRIAGGSKDNSVYMDNPSIVGS